MTSVASEPQDLLEPARKRQRISPHLPNLGHVEYNAVTNSMSGAQTTAHKLMMSQREREAQAGILCFVNESNPGFSGILKQRYTDFLVNEVALDGKVVHLTDINGPRRKAATWASRRNPSPSAEGTIEVEEPIMLQAETAPSDPAESIAHAVSKQPEIDAKLTNHFTLSAQDTALLDTYFGIKVRMAILKLYEKALLNPQAKPGSLGSVSSEPISDRQLRGKLHQDMRRIFNSCFETVTGADDIITIMVAQKNKPQGRLGQGRNNKEGWRNHQKNGRLTWQELGGEHLHFSLYKENKDTMEVIAYISSQLKTSPKQFSFAGTKDRRGVTVQRVSVFRVYADVLANLNRALRGSKVGNFQYENHRLELGDLMGNKFTITLRDCTFGDSNTVEGEDKVDLADRLIGNAVKNMQVHGFINYYGLQRFGTYAVGTDDIGKKILQGDFEGAINAILTYGNDALACALDPVFVPPDGKPLARDDIARAEALHIFKSTGQSQIALEKLPKKFSGEASIIRHMNRNKRDFVGALLQVPRNLRLMYVHAYQSLVWNMVASQRWTRYRDNVVKGDLVVVDSESTNHIERVRGSEVDENGEIIVLPSAGDAAVSHDDLFERARALTADEAASGKYTIFDVVLPTPGYDVEYPDNDVGDYYKEFMISERGGGLDPGNMRRAQQDFSLSGSYRKLMAQIGNDITYEIKVYTDDNEQMVETDLEKITKSRVNFGTPNQEYRSRKGRENGGEQRGGQSYRNQENGENNRGVTHDDKNSKQRDAWKNLPSTLAEEEKAQADLFEAQRAANSGLPRVEVSQPAYIETFIQTSAEHGKRTGYRETTVVQGVKAEGPQASADGETAAKEEGKPGSVAEMEAGATDPAKHEVIGDAERFAPAVDRTESDVKPGPKIQEEEKKDETGGDDALESSPVDDASDSHVREAREKIAVIIKFQLGSSQYATMALRELMKQGGLQTYKPEFGSGR